MSANPSGANDIDTSTIAGAVSRLMSSDEPEPMPTGTEEEQAAQEPQAEESAQAEESETLEQEHDSQPAPEVEMHTVKVNGEEFEVTLDELRAGYMKNQDYQNKTKSLHQSRDALEAKQNDIDTRLQEAETLIGAELNNLESPEMLQLKEDDPETYLREFERVQGRANTLAAAKEKRESEKQAKRNDLVAKEMEALKVAIPEWLDPEVQAKEGGEIVQRWKDMGYTDEQIANVIDHTRFVESRKAMLYDRLMSQNLEEKKVVAPPKAQKPGVSKAGEDRTSEKIKQARNKLRKTGKPKDAASLIKQMITES